MKLPNAHFVIVEREKITAYLLNSAHRFGASNARFFISFGFRLDEWETLARALSEHAQRRAVSADRDTGFGCRYEVDGPLSTPDRRNPPARTVWQLDSGEVAPRLITSYPLPVS
jgi:hypothetical protein